MLMVTCSVGATLEYAKMRTQIFPALKARTKLLDMIMIGVMAVTCLSAVLSQLVEENDSYRSARLWYLLMRVLQFIVTPLCTLIIPLSKETFSATGNREVAKNEGARRATSSESREASTSRQRSPSLPMEDSILPYVCRLLCDWAFLSIATSALVGMMRIRMSDDAGNRIGVSKSVFVIMTPWVGDAGALLIGGKFGQHRVVPKLSPNKTLEGFLSLILFTLISTYGMRYLGYLIWPDYVFNKFHREANPVFLFLATITAAFASAVGDLIESALKRIAGVKDTSTLFGPHGGILDKLDSILLTTICVSHLIA